MSHSRYIAEAPAPALEIRNLKKSFGRQSALDGIAITLNQGECLGLLGPNGAGKTTLVRCIARRIRADDGEIMLMGEPIAPQGASSLLGIVPQELAIYEDLSAFQNLHFFGRFHGLRGRELRRRVNWALEWTGLQDRAKHLVRFFSGGMKRRVNLACGVMHSPRVLLLDEPTVGVDPQSRERIYTMIDSLSAEGCSILLTTHHMEEAEGQCERLVIMDRGRLVAEGTIDELIDCSVGSSRAVRLRVDRRSMDKQRIDLGSLQYQDLRVISNSGDEQIVDIKIKDVVKNIPLILRQLSDRDILVNDIEIQTPSLHDVFLALTGEQLRDV